MLKRIHQLEEDIYIIKNELELTSYFIPNVSFIFKSAAEEKTFISKNGLKDFAASRITKPLHKNYIYNSKHFEDNVDIEVFAQWTAGYSSTLYYSFLK